MNILEGELRAFENLGDFVIAQICVKDEFFDVFMIDPQSLGNLQIPSKIELLFKEHELSFADLNSVLSVENTFVATITHIKKGELLWYINFDFRGIKLSSIISAKKGKELDLCENQQKLCFVKANDITLRT